MEQKEEKKVSATPDVVNKWKKSSKSGVRFQCLRADSKALDATEEAFLITISAEKPSTDPIRYN